MTQSKPTARSRENSPPPDDGEFVEILRILGCACGTKVEARCGRRAAELFLEIDLNGHHFDDTAKSLGLPLPEARALLELARQEVVGMLCLALAFPSDDPANLPESPGGCDCPPN